MSAQVQQKIEAQKAAATQMPPIVARIRKQLEKLGYSIQYESQAKPAKGADIHLSGLTHSYGCLVSVEKGNEWFTLHFQGLKIPDHDDLTIVIDGVPVHDSKLLSSSSNQPYRVYGNQYTFKLPNRKATQELLGSTKPRRRASQEAVP